MDLELQKKAEDNIAFSSSVAADIWHPRKGKKAYEWWYFDALSDDGREAIVITFLDNFIYSPRYNRPDGTEAELPERTSDNGVAAGQSRFPALAFTCFRDGRPLYRTTLEFPENAFDADENEPYVRIGHNSFTYRLAPYGAGYHIQIDAPMSAGRRIRANFEWLVIEADLRDGKKYERPPAHAWNMVAPRCDVTGKVAICDRKGIDKDVFQFRGTGYHDHKLDNRWLAKTVHDWHWGRAHFADTTAVFYRFRETGEDRASTKLIIVHNSEMTERNVQFDEQNYVRNKFGIRYPTRLRLVSDDNVRLTVKPLTIIDSNFFYLRFLSEMSLTLQDGLIHQTTGITEFLMPKALKYRWLTWLTDIRTGKNGRGPRI